MKRNLLYFICPLNREAWQWNIKKLLSYWKVFTGRRIILIATDETTDSYSSVTPFFYGYDVELVFAKNDRKLRETAHLIRLLSEVRSTDPNETTFFAHTKGGSYRGEQLQRIFRWTDSMYTLNLGSPDSIDKILRIKSSVGCYLQHQNHGGSNWHYAGTYFWFRNSAIFSRNWMDISLETYGAEGYLGRHIPESEAESLTPFFSSHDLFYNPPTPDIYTKWLDRT